MTSIPSGITIEVNPVQFVKAAYPMLVSVAGSVISRKLEQPKNASYPMVIRLSGSVTALNAVQSINA